jgi:hypothetical protein
LRQSYQVGVCVTKGSKFFAETIKGLWLGWPFPASLGVKCALQRLFNAAYDGTQRGRAYEMWMFKETNLRRSLGAWAASLFESKTRTNCEARYGELFLLADRQ